MLTTLIMRNIKSRGHIVMRRKPILPGIIVSIASAFLAACGGSGTPTTATTNAAAPGSASTASSTTIELSASTYSVAAGAGAATVQVSRVGSAAGAVSVSYATANGTATAGTDFTATSGILQWQSGDTSSKSISIPIAKATSGKNFKVALSSVTGGVLGTPSTATVAIAAASGGSGASGTIALGASTYTTVPGTLTLQVTRSGGSSGAASVAYATANGTATAGSDYTAASGTLQWQSGDAASKNISVTISNSGVGKNFTVTLSGAAGATLGSPGATTITIVAPSTGSASLSIRVQGDHFIDANSLPIQLRGVNVSGLEYTAVQGWDAADPWGGMHPNWTAIKSWDANAVRLPLNEASWLGYTCIDGTGASRNPDPGHNYQATVAKAVADATAAGLIRHRRLALDCTI